MKPFLTDEDILHQKIIYIKYHVTFFFSLVTVPKGKHFEPVNAVKNKIADVLKQLAGTRLLLTSSTCGNYDWISV